ncbi:MAG: hypothetical protein GXO76_07810 [Calditrichaeota bacterium]|nr:hypothetical protein [Calditrichota bacterium]
MTFKKWVAVAMACFAWMGVSQAADLSGNLSGSLSVSGSPYRIVDDVFVLASDTLRIEPGVVLQFAGDFRLNVYGKLFAEGTEEDSIFFESANSEPLAGAWGGIYLDHAQAGSKFAYLRISYAKTGLVFDGSNGLVVHCLFRKNVNGMDIKNNSSPQILQNHFLWNSSAALRVLYSQPQIRANKIFHNSESGAETAAVVFGNVSGGTFVGNIVARNTKAGVDCNLSAHPLICNNTIVDNLYGVTVATGASPKIVNNIVLQNELGIAIDDGSPRIRYNCLWDNSLGNFYNPPDSVGKMIVKDSLGDSLDAYHNRITDPGLINPDALNFAPLEDSHIIDTGDPGNPGGIKAVGAAPDIGAVEWSTTMPVELEAFYYDGQALVWETASESKNYGFEIYRDTRDHWTAPRKIGFVPGKGNSSSGRLYRFVDPERDYLSGDVQYRLKQIDFDGSATWSKVLLVKTNQKNSLRISSNYPNPFNGETSFVLFLPRRSRVSVTVFNALGREVSTLIPNQWLPAGTQHIRWKGSDSAGNPVVSGRYFLRVKVDHRLFVREMTYLK